jgi:hypothetical protein
MLTIEIPVILTTAYMQSGFLVCSMSIVLINDIFRLDLFDFIQTMSTTMSKSTRFEMAFIYFKNQYSDGLYCSLYWYFVFHWVVCFVSLGVSVVFISIVMFCTVRSIGIFCFTRCFCCVYQDSDALFCSFYWYVLFH